MGAPNPRARLTPRLERFLTRAVRRLSALQMNIASSSRYSQTDQQFLLSPPPFAPPPLPPSVLPPACPPCRLLFRPSSLPALLPFLLCLYRAAPRTGDCWPEFDM